jgi:hypothetical protein
VVVGTVVVGSGTVVLVGAVVVPGAEVVGSADVVVTGGLGVLPLSDDPRDPEGRMIPRVTRSAKTAATPAATGACGRHSGGSNARRGSMTVSFQKRVRLAGTI